MDDRSQSEPRLRPHDLNRVNEAVRAEVALLMVNSFDDIPSNCIRAFAEKITAVITRELMGYLDTSGGKR